MAKTAPCPRCRGEVPLPENGSEIVNCPLCHARLAKNTRGFALRVCEALVVVIPLCGIVFGYTEKDMRELSLGVAWAAVICAMVEFGRPKLRIVDETPAGVTLSRSMTAGQLQSASRFSLFRRRSPFER